MLYCTEVATYYVNVANPHEPPGRPLYVRHFTAVAERTRRDPFPLAQETGVSHWPTDDCERSRIILRKRAARERHACMKSNHKEERPSPYVNDWTSWVLWFGGCHTASHPMIGLIYSSRLGTNPSGFSIARGREVSHLGTYYVATTVSMDVISKKREGRRIVCRGPTSHPEHKRETLLFLGTWG